ncbi:terpene synthase family protein [Agrobacterium sp. NPDC090283]|uniref:terpene synthase family protein n=1 Tax=Agrobacterium sp. NPDC090283 TaxID=3363920 RepID=UPI003839DEEC
MSNDQDVFASGIIKFGDKLHYPEPNFVLKHLYHPDTEVALEKVRAADWPCIEAFYKNKRAAETYHNQRLPLWFSLACPTALSDRVFWTMQMGDLLTLMDDHFSNPHVINSPDRLQEIEKIYIAALDGIRPSDLHPVGQLFHDNIQHMLNTLSLNPPARQRLYDAAYKLIMALSHPLVRHIQTLTLEEYLVFRRYDVFIDICATIIEFAIDVDMGDALETSEDLRQARLAMMDGVLITNDIGSFRKEFSSNEAMNSLWVFVYQEKLDVQGALYRAFELTRQLEQDLIAARDRVLASPLGGRTDVQRYLTALEYMFSGNIEYNSISPRYIGPDAKGAFHSGEIVLEQFRMPVHIAGENFLADE